MSSDGERGNRRELILERAAELFMAQGFKATSVRQIAAAVGCTEAALYYHFKEGKRALLQAVVESNLPEFLSVLQACRRSQTLEELVTTFGQGLAQRQSLRRPRLRWLIAEFPQLSRAEQALVQEKFQLFHAALAALVQRHLPQAELAGPLAWLLICAVMGYGLLFFDLNLAALADFPADSFLALLAQRMPASFPAPAAGPNAAPS